MATLRIEHHTIYRYARALEFGRHRLVLRPREGHDVRVVQMSLDIFPAHRVNWSRDVFGNSIAVVDFTEQAERLEFRSEFVVQRTLPFAAEEPHARQHVPFPVVYDPLEQTIAAAYQHSSYPDDVDPLRAWLEEVLPDRDATGQRSHTVHRQRSHESRVWTAFMPTRYGLGRRRSAHLLAQ